MFRIAAILLALLALPTVASAQETIDLGSIQETATTEITINGEEVTSVDNYDSSPEASDHAPGRTAPRSRTFRHTPGFGYSPSSMRQYEQGQAPWGQRPFGGVSGNPTMASSGCGPTSLAMVGATLTGNTKKYTPATVAYHYRWAYAGRVSLYVPGGRDVLSQAGNWMGLKTRRIGRDLDLAAQTLKQGGLVIGLFGPGRFTSNGHYMVLISVQGGGFKIANPNRSKQEGVRITGAELVNGGLLQLWSYRR